MIATCHDFLRRKLGRQGRCSFGAKMKSSLHTRVAERFGVLPNFFRLASDDPQITENLWGFAQFAYLDNPIPSLFKERLFVYLSRFCKIRYCIARHLGFLVGLGNLQAILTAFHKRSKRLCRCFDERFHLVLIWTHTYLFAWNVTVILFFLNQIPRTNKRFLLVLRMYSSRPAMPPRASQPFNMRWVHQRSNTSGCFSLSSERHTTGLRYTPNLFLRTILITC